MIKYGMCTSFKRNFILAHLIKHNKIKNMYIKGLNAFCIHVVYISFKLIYKNRFYLFKITGVNTISILKIS